MSKVGGEDQSRDQQLYLLNQKLVILIHFLKRGLMELKIVPGDCRELNEY